MNGLESLFIALGVGFVCAAVILFVFGLCRSAKIGDMSEFEKEALEKERELIRAALERNNP